MKSTAVMLLAALVLFLAYAAAYAAIRRLLPLQPPLAQSAWLLLGCAPAAAAAAAALWKRRVLGPEAATAVVVMFALGGACFTFTAPAVLDRSVSLQMLDSLDAGGQVGMTEDDVTQAFVDGYLDGNEAMRKRLSEHVGYGFIVVDDGRYYITDAGRRFMQLARFVSRLFDFDERIVSHRG